MTTTAKLLTMAMDEYKQKAWKAGVWASADEVVYKAITHAIPMIQEEARRDQQAAIAQAIQEQADLCPIPRERKVLQATADFLRQPVEAYVAPVTTDRLMSAAIKAREAKSLSRDTL
jgi:hypothetical protein